MAKKKDEQIHLLESRLQQASATIANLNSSIGFYSNAFTIAGLLLGVFTIGIGFTTYFLGIKPSQEAITKLESNMDDKIEIYLLNRKKKDIEYAVWLVETKNPVAVMEGFNYFYRNPFDP